MSLYVAIFSSVNILQIFASSKNYDHFTNLLAAYEKAFTADEFHQLRR